MAQTEKKNDAPITKDDLTKAIASAQKTPQELRLEAQEESRRRREAAARVTPLVPIEGENIEDALQTDRALEEAAKLADEQQKKKIEAEAKLYQFFVKCRHPHGKDKLGRPLPQHGLYLKNNPSAGVVAMTEWKARYKPSYEEMYLGNIVCQVCLREFGIERELDIVLQKRGTFTVDPRWLWRRPNDMERMMAEGETRANDVQYASSNIGRKEAADRARDAGLEVYA